jgi:hypothetical protein
MVNNGKIKEVTEDMGGNAVKLISISIKKLYGCYDYNVNFNSDVTFIYGMNGCGKTTILNITEAIITGQLFKLFNYDFKTITLYYAKNADSSHKKLIKISYVQNSLEINFNDRDYTINLLDADNNIIRSNKNMRDISMIYNNRYDFFQEIQNTFNYVYLPLNRSYIPYDEVDSLYVHGRIHNKFLKNSDIYSDNDSRDGAMIKIESLIYQNHSRASMSINRINDSFRNDILKPQIGISNSYKFTDFLNEIEDNNVPKLQKTQKEYIRILKELNIINEQEEENYNKFFENFIEEFADYTNRKNKEGISLELIFKFQEISRIQKTIEMAEKMEQRKAAVMKPMETFLNTMNSFIGHSDDGKELYVNGDGQIYFKTKYSKEQISIQHLSSGEKQLITFFSNLIFMVKDKSSGIFVVDEPELSLHLSWQKIFIDKVLEVNKNIQLIFATHAPEIIGNRRNKMYKLEKEYIKVDE